MEAGRERFPVGPPCVRQAQKYVPPSAPSETTLNPDRTPPIDNPVGPSKPSHLGDSNDISPTNYFVSPHVLIPIGNVETYLVLHIAPKQHLLLLIPENEMCLSKKMVTSAEAALAAIQFFLEGLLIMMRAHLATKRKAVENV